MNMSAFNDASHGLHFKTLPARHSQPSHFIRHVSTSQSHSQPDQQQQQQPPENSNSKSPKLRRKSIREEIEEHSKLVNEGRSTKYDSKLIPFSESLQFPRIKTTSLSTKRIVITDEAKKYPPVTLVLVAFRNFADVQLMPWKDFYTLKFPNLKWYDVTVNESFASQAFSGFVQGWQRSFIEDIQLHDYHVAFNSKARQPLEDLLITNNRMFGNVLLLDRLGHVRFRAAGSPNDQALSVLVDCVMKLENEGNDNAQNRRKANNDENSSKQ